MRNLQQRKRMSNNAQFTLKLLIEQKNKCYYCGKKCYLYLNDRESGLHQKHNAATIEHLYSKLDIRRYTINGCLYKVMSCFECNEHLGLTQYALIEAKGANVNYMRDNEIKGLVIDIWNGLYDHQHII